VLWAAKPGLLHRRDGVVSLLSVASDSMAAALVVMDEVALSIRAVGGLAVVADISREEVAVITQCAALVVMFELEVAPSSRSSSCSDSPALPRPQGQNSPAQKKHPLPTSRRRGPLVFFPRPPLPTRSSDQIGQAQAQSRAEEPNLERPCAGC
jgi:hypothetical protein